jgi:hypothetical protein
MLGNMPLRGNKILNAGLLQLQGRLPEGWTVAASPKRVRGDTRVGVVAPDRRTALVTVQVRSQLELRQVAEVAASASPPSKGGAFVLIAPYLSPAARQRLREAGVGFLDLTGNVRIELREPGLFIDARGADKDPDRKRRPSRSLRGAKAGRIIRILLDSKISPGVRDLAGRAEVDPGYVSRILALLQREALIQRDARGRVGSVDWPNLLRRWAEEAPLKSRGIVTMCLEPRGLASLQTRLTKLQMNYALTGGLVATRLAPVAALRLAVIYVDDARQAIAELDLRPTEAGANVMVIEPDDARVLFGAVSEQGLKFVAPSQAAADLLTSPGRGPAEAEALISWMSQNEDAWRG